MNKQQLIRAMAIEANMNQDTARAALDAALLVITEALADGNEVKLVGFGTFRPVQRAAREGRNPKTGEPVMIPVAIMPRLPLVKG